VSAPAERPRRPTRLAAVTGRLAAAQGAIVIVSLVTAPLQARALGAAGRGDLAAILVPLGFFPVLLSFGLGRYASFSVARGRALPDVFGSLTALYVAVGVMLALTAPWIADFLAEGREDVRTVLLIGLLLLPIGLLMNFVAELAVGLEEWPRLLLSRMIAPTLQLVGVTALYVTDTLTVVTAAALSLAAGPLVVIPLWPILRRSLPPRFHASILRAGFSFGTRAWLGGLSSVANTRIDQLLMIRLVSAKELGLYAVAVTLSQFFVNPVIDALTTATRPRIARGETELAARSLRTSLAGVLITGTIVAALSPLVLRYLFGTEFTAALPYTLVLLVASLPLAGRQVLNVALSSHGRPGLSAQSELVSLAISVPALFLLLPALGAIGAAIVSVVAYVVTLAFLLFHARREFGGSLASFLIPTREDVRLIVAIPQGVIARRLGRRSRGVAGG
jgi:O-antigen/teichoic acid export membrane protein